MNRIAPTSAWRVLVPALTLTGATALLLTAFLAFSVHQRLDGYVEVDGTVRAFTSVIGPDVTEIEVEYDVAGDTRVDTVVADGFVEVQTDDVVPIMVPADGSSTSDPRLPASAATVTLGWLSVLIGLAGMVCGIGWLVRASLRRNRALRESMGSAPRLT